jgi:hypothetical protein
VAQQVSWDRIRRLASDVYKWRSKALHAGIPIPAPMLTPPYRWDETDALEESLSVPADGTGSAMWMAEDISMLLHVFEHLIRGCLVRWWKSLATIPAITVRGGAREVPSPGESHSLTDTQGSP